MISVMLVYISHPSLVPPSLGCSNDSERTCIVEQPQGKESPKEHSSSAYDDRQLLSERNKKGNGTTSSKLTSESFVIHI